MADLGEGPLPPYAARVAVAPPLGEVAVAPPLSGPSPPLRLPGGGAIAPPPGNLKEYKKLNILI